MLKKLLTPLSFFVAMTLPSHVYAYEPGYYSTETPLSSGRWVKIAVDTCGVYEIDSDELRQMGFADPSKVRVYGYGGVLAHHQYFDGNVPDRLPQTPSVVSSDQRLVFYAEGPVKASFKNSAHTSVSVSRNYYSRQGYYFLSDVAGQADTETIAYSPTGAEPCDRHYCISMDEHEETGFDGGVVFTDEPLAHGQSRTTKFAVRDCAADSDGDPIVYRVETCANSRQQLTFDLDIEGGIVVSKVAPVNAGNTAATILYTLGEGYSYLIGRSRDFELKSTLTVPASASADFAAIDRSYIIYPRYNVLRDDSPELMMNFSGLESGSAVSLSGAEAGACVWDVTDPAEVKVYETFTDGEKTLFTIDGASPAGGRRIVAFNPEGRHRKVEVIGEVDNQNLHALRTPDMIIFTVKGLREAAEELAWIHRLDGLDVLVVDQEEAFNEYGSGTPTPAAMRRLMKMFYDREPGKLKYVLLYGRSSCDPRFITHAPGEYLLTHECEIAGPCRDSGANYATDQYFGMLSDSYNPQRIEFEQAMVSVGRLGPEDLAEGRQINAKISDYLSAPPAPSTALRLLRCSDDDNDGIHLRNAKALTDSMLALNGNLYVAPADILYYPYSGLTATTSARIVANSLERGSGFFHYNGHGGENGLSGEGVYTTAIAKSLRYDSPGLMMFSSCSSLPFDLKSGALAEVAAYTRGGGAIGCIGACRAVYLEFNRQLSLNVGKAYSEAGAGATGADIFRNGRNSLVSGKHVSSDAANNALCYNYCGDPAVRLPIASCRIDFESPVESMLARGEVKIKAIVKDESGRHLGNFNGQALIEVFDNSTVAEPTKPVAGVTSEQVYNNLMGEFAAEVVGGRIETVIVLPDSYLPGSDSRIVITASDTGKRLYAAGVLKGLTIESNDSEPATAEPARIVEFYINQDDYTSAESVRSDIRLHATIKPSAAGIACGNTGVRSCLNLVLDEGTTYPEIQNHIRYDAAGFAHIDFEITGLTFGAHTLELRVPDNSGGLANTYLDFTVGGQALGGRLTMEDTDKPVREEAVFDLDTDGTAKRLVIVDSDSETILSEANPSFPYRWNLTDGRGAKVPDGLYRAWVILESNQARGATDALEITVIKL